MKESERLVIQRKQHSKLSFSIQQEKPLTVEKLWAQGSHTLSGWATG